MVEGEGYYVLYHKLKGMRVGKGFQSVASSMACLQRQLISNFAWQEVFIAGGWLHRGGTLVN